MSTLTTMAAAAANDELGRRVGDLEKARNWRAAWARLGGAEQAAVRYEIEQMGGPGRAIDVALSVLGSTDATREDAEARLEAIRREREQADRTWEAGRGSLPGSTQQAASLDAGQRLPMLLDHETKLAEVLARPWAGGAAVRRGVGAVARLALPVVRNRTADQVGERLASLRRDIETCLRHLDGVERLAAQLERACEASFAASTWDPATIKTLRDVLGVEYVPVVQKIATTAPQN